MFKIRQVFHGDPRSGTSGCICDITTAVTGPPPNNDDLKTGMIGGSRSPLCYASIHFV
jgi:hypothetical protein